MGLVCEPIGSLSICYWLGVPAPLPLGGDRFWYGATPVHTPVYTPYAVAYVSRCKYVWLVEIRRPGTGINNNLSASSGKGVA